MAGPRHRRDHHPVTLAAHPGRVGLQEAERGREIQRPPPPATLALIVSRAAPPAMRAAIKLPRTRADRHHQHPACLVELDLLDHRPPQPEQLLPYPQWAHVATLPSHRFLLSEAKNRRSPAACAPSCPEVGRSQRPDLIAKQRGRRRLSSSANPATSSENVSRATAGRHALLDQTTTAALPRARVHLTHGTCRGAVFPRQVVSPGCTVGSCQMATRAGEQQVAPVSPAFVTPRAPRSTDP
jgi:hypothetical protein